MTQPVKGCKFDFRVTLGPRSQNRLADLCRFNMSGLPADLQISIRCAFVVGIYALQRPSLEVRLDQSIHHY